MADKSAIEWTEPFRPRGLGFVEVCGNGYMYLTPAGWACVNLLEFPG